MASDRRVSEFDAMRVVAASVVVFIHSSSTAVAALGAHPGWDVLFLLHKYSIFAVPAFIFMAGALSWARELEPGVKGYLDFIRRRLARIIPAYVAWSVVYWYMRYRGLGFVPMTAEEATLRGFLKALVTGDAWGHLYFVPLIILVYAVTPIAGRLARRNPAVLFVGLLAGAAFWRAFAGSVGGPLAHDLSRFVSLLPAAAAGAWYVLSRDRAGAPAWWEVRGWPTFLVGGLVVQSALVTGSVGLLPGWIASTADVLWPIAVTLGVAGASAFAGARLPRLAAAVSVLAPLTYGVYLAHQAFLILLFRATRIWHLPAIWSSQRLLQFKWGYTMVASFALVAALAALARRLRPWLRGPDSND